MSHSLIVLPDQTVKSIVDAIHSARKSVRVKMFLFSHPGLLKAVIAAKKRGVDVRVMLNPKGSNRLGPQIVIDAPASQPDTVVARAFFVGGWAADLDSTVDRGVDTVHVWAYPVNDDGAYEQPIFIGPAGFGGARPDVAAVYGARFENSGYGIIVKDLAPGTYDIAVFAYSTVRGGFAPAKTVRVNVR